MYRTATVCVPLIAAMILIAGATPAAEEARAPAAKEQEVSVTSAAEGQVVLDTHSYWRAHVTLRPTVFGTRDDARTHPRGRLAGRGWSRKEPVLPENRPYTPLPPANWMEPDFNDSQWWRDPGPFFGGAAYMYEQRARPHESRYGWISQPISLALLCVRGKFAVDDPVRVKSLKLSVEFRGGAVVYLNGKEVARSHLPTGKTGPETLADDYPTEAYVDEKGEFLYHWNPHSLATKPEYAKLKERAELRVRKIESLELPTTHLRKGVNVLALEIHRAALASVALKTNRNREDGCWNTVGLMSTRLVAEGGGITSNSRRPSGLEVWNVNPVESLFDTDYGDPNEPLRPVLVVGARNGRFSGQVVVSSTEALKNLKVEVSKLEHEDGKFSLPPTRIRYPRAELVEGGGKTVTGEKSRLPSYRFDALLETLPSVVEVKHLTLSRGKQWEGEAPWLGAVQPIWLTVSVPGNAPAGRYGGNLTVTANGSDPVTVPVEVRVHGFRLPDVKELRTWVDFVEAPENLAVKYNIPLWSEEHWSLVRKSMGFLAEVHNKTLYVPLICRTNHGNSQSMVRWVRKGDGSYDYDFSLMERYLDIAREAGLEPEVVCFQVWDYHIGRDTWWKIGTGMYSQTTVNEPQQIPVTLLDLQTHETEELKGPKYGSPEAEDFWRPVAAGVLKRVNRQGWGEAITLGLSGDYVPPKSTVQMWARLWPGVPWAAMAHGSAKDFYGVPVGYMVTILHRDFAVDPEIRRSYGWKRKQRIALFDRFKGRLHAQLAYHRVTAEISLMSNLRGPGRMALDSFVWRSRYPGTSWGGIGLPPAVLAAGPEGPVSTCRFEMFREGLQECEARIFIEQALQDEKQRIKLGDTLAAECQALLDERTRYIIWSDETNTNGKNHCSLPRGPLGFDWYAGSGWQERSAQLYEMAAEVQKVLGGQNRWAGRESPSR